MGKEVIVIGAGAAGLMAAITAAKAGAHVTLLEKNAKPGRKILETGNGRCNLTNTVQDPSCYHSEDGDAAWRIIERFDVYQTIRFFTDLGIYTKNREGWIYPHSDQASALLQALLLEAAYRKVRLKTNEAVQRVAREMEGYAVSTATYTYRAGSVIIACGSPAHLTECLASPIPALTGASVERIPLRPALVSLRAAGSRPNKWGGVRVHGTVTLLLQEDKDVKTGPFETGQIQLTDYGISGIPVFSLSRHALRAHSEGRPVSARLDFLPEFTDADLAGYIRMQEKNCPYKNIREQLSGLLPQKLLDMLVDTDADIRDNIARIKRYRVAISGAHSLRQAQVCSGGVSFSALDRNLQARSSPGLYFAGECVDVDGRCGGYNLQWAWSSGHVAALAAAREL